MANTSGYTAYLRANNVPSGSLRDFQVTCTATALGVTQKGTTRTFHHTLRIDLTERYPIYRFCLRDRTRSQGPMGCDQYGLGTQGTLHFGLYECKTDADLQATSAFVHTDEDLLIESDFIVVDRADNIVPQSLYDVSSVLVDTYNDPQKAYHIKGYDIHTLCAANRTAIRNFLLDPRHIFVVFNPLLPWYRRIWLQYYLWLPDWPGTYSAERSGDPNAYPGHRRSERLQQQRQRQQQ